MGTLGFASALMIAVGYPGESIVEGNLLWIRGVFRILVRCLPLHRLQIVDRPEGRHPEGAESRSRIHVKSGLLGNRHLVVHLSHRLFVSFHGCFRCECSCWHPDWILCIRCHLQMRRWFLDLQYHNQEIGTVEG